MLRSYLAVAFRHLLKHKVYTLISLSGLALGLATCLLLTVFVAEQFAVADFHGKGDTVYRVLRRDDLAGSDAFGSGIDGGLTLAVREEVAEVEQTTRFLNWGMWVRHGDKNLMQYLCLADVSLFDMFDLRLVDGDPHGALADPGSIVVTQSAARRYFGDADPVGATVTVDNDKMGGDYMITGVVGDIPDKSHVGFDFMTAHPPAGSPSYFAENAWAGWRDTWYPFEAWVQLRRGVTAAEVEARLPALVEPHRGVEHVRGSTYRLQRLNRIHLYSETDFGRRSDGDITFLRTLGLIGAFVLVIACINFMNLAMARSTHRAREIGLRKVLGAHRRQLAGQFLGEAVLIAGLALVLSIPLALVSLPLFNDLLGEAFTIRSFADPGLAAWMLALAAAAGLLAGSYPALALSGLQPASILKTSARFGRGALLRKGLVVFQFAATVILVVCTAVVYGQTDYMKSRDLGLDQEHVVVMPIGFADLSLPERYEAVKARFAEHPNVLAVTAPWGFPGMWEQHFTVRPEGEDEDWRMLVQGIDNDFLETLGIELVAGRNADVRRKGQPEFLLNETAVRRLGWDDPVGRTIEWLNQEGVVVGVVADYHSRSMHSMIEPILLADWLHLVIAVRMAPRDVPETMAFLEETWHHFVPHRPFEARFLDEAYDSAYWSEERQGRSFATLSGLAIFIACLGLLGLTAFTCQQRTKEVSIRRVLGAGTGSVLGLLLRESLWAVLLGNLAAWPIAWYAMRGWLEDYPYAIDLRPEIFLAATAAVLVVAVLTTCSQTLRAAWSSPVDALRHE